MGSENKQIAKNTILLYCRMLVLMVISLFTSRVNLQTLGVDDFGIYNVVGGIVATFSVISGALGVAISRNITFELGRGDVERQKRVFSMSINIQVLISLIIFFLANTIGIWFLNTMMVIPPDRLIAANWVMQCSLITFIIGLISVPFNSSIIAHEEMSAFAYISIFEALAKLLLAYSLYISPVDKLITFAVLLTIVQVVLCLIYVTYCSKKFTECRYKFIKDRALFKQMSGFAGWTMFGNLAWVGYTYGINIILNLFFGPAVNAARGVAVQVQNAIQNFCTNFQMALNPQITKNYACGNISRMHQLVLASSKYSFFLLLFISLPILIEANLILNVWLGIVPDHTVNFLRLILFVICVEAIANPMTVSAQSNGNIKLYQMVVGGMMLLILPLAYIVLKLGYEPEFVFIVHLFVVVLAQIVRLLFMRKMIGLSLRLYFREVVVKILIVFVCSSVIPLIIYFEMPESITRFLLVCSTSVFCVSSSVYLLGLNSIERTVVKQKVSSKLMKLRNDTHNR